MAICPRTSRWIICSAERCVAQDPRNLKLDVVMVSIRIFDGQCIDVACGRVASQVWASSSETC